MNMKHEIIQGVPYLINDAKEVFLYENPISSSPVKIGTYDKNSLSLLPNWKELSQAFVNRYRESLKHQTEVAMAHAREVQGVA